MGIGESKGKKARFPGVRCNFLAGFIFHLLLLHFYSTPLPTSHTFTLFMAFFDFFRQGTIASASFSHSFSAHRFYEVMRDHLFPENGGSKVMLAKQTSKLRVWVGRWLLSDTPPRIWLWLFLVAKESEKGKGKRIMLTREGELSGGGNYWVGGRKMVMLPRLRFLVLRKLSCACWVIPSQRW